MSKDFVSVIFSESYLLFHWKPFHKLYLAHLFCSMSKESLHHFERAQVSSQHPRTIKIKDLHFGM